MTSFESATIGQLALHKVGNKYNEETVRLSNEPLSLQDEIETLLLTYFTKPFKNTEYFTFYNEDGLDHNPVYQAVKTIFEDPATLFGQSETMANLLYEQSVHPNIKGGDFFVVYFCDCVVDGEVTDAIGLFKSESKDTFLKIYPENENFGIASDKGININKLDKGCLVFNTEADKGFMVSVVDTISKGNEAVYWVDDFLGVLQREDNYFYTNQAITLCKDFVTKKLPQEFEIGKADQADMLNRSAQYFKENESFNVESYAADVIQHAEVMDSFKNFTQDYAEENQVPFQGNFEINPSAVKKQSKQFKSVIKLDKNFHVYVHGNRDRIVKGYDEDRGMHFYQLFFEEEN
ncbi:MAG: nucleoid-associated protein [Bacteroidota bacterium]